MATLGNYIHYNWENYQKYGTNRNTPGSINTKIIEAQKNELLAQVTSRGRQAGLQKLEAAYNDMLYPTIQEVDPAANEKMQRYLEATIGDMVTKWGLQWEGLGAKGGPVSNGYKFGEKIGYKISSVNNLIQRAKNVQQQLMKNPNPQLIKQLDTILELANEASKVAKSYLRKWGNNGDQMVYYSAMSLGKKGYYQGIIRQLNDALTAVSTATYQQAVGDALEYASATLDDRVSNAVDNVSVKLIQDTIVTGKKSNTITFSGLDSHMKQLQSSFKHTVEDAAVEIKTNGNNIVQGIVFKADVDLLYGGETYKISAKNYNLANDNRISMVQDTPLLNVLLKNTSNDFINHAFNILFASKGDARQKSYQAQVYEAIKTISIIEAVAGISQKAGAADTLVINNRSKRKVKVISISDLVTPTMLKCFNVLGLNNLGEENNKWQGNKNKKDWLESKKRVDSLLTFTHTQKIKVSLNSSSLFKN